MAARPVRAVFDTNILIDFLKGNTDARAELDRYESPAVSLVSWMELLVGAASTEEDASLDVRRKGTVSGVAAPREQENREEGQDRNSNADHDPHVLLVPPPG